MWVYKPSTCAPEVPSEASCSRRSDSHEPCAMSRTTTTASDSSSNGCETDISPTPRSGMTSRPSTGDPGVDAWISSLGVSPANRFPLPANVKGLPTSAIFGLRFSGLSGRYDPEWYWWRTSQASLLGDEDSAERESILQVIGLDGFRRLNRAPSDALPVSFPKSGMTRNGMLYLLRPSAPRTGGTGSGLWRTPSSTVIEAKSSVVKLTGRKPTDPQVGLADQVKRWPTPQNAYDGRTHEAWVAAKERAAERHRSGEYAKGTGAPGMMDLQRAVKQWPTPRSTMSSPTLKPSTDKPHATGGPPKRLEDEVARAMWPTPQVPTGGQGLPDDATLEGNTYRRPDGQKVQLGLSAAAGGQLNPDFVAWLMGWPLGWDSLEPLPEAALEQDPWLDGEWPGVPRVAVGVEKRVDRLKVLGNGWVPQCAAVVGLRIMAALGLTTPPPDPTEDTP